MSSEEKIEQESKSEAQDDEIESKIENDDEETEEVKQDNEQEDEQIIEHDPYLVDEKKLAEDEEKLSDEEKNARLEEALEHKKKANELFNSQNYTEALEAYTKALSVCPLKFNKERSIFYSNRSICFYKEKLYEKCIQECSRSIELDSTFVKPLLRRADCYENTDKLDEAFEDYKKLVELEPRNVAHKQKCVELEEKIKERNEKLKTEMMSKLKDLGNMVLKPFGLSTENFQFVQDPNTGSYSVNFKKN